MNPKTQLESLAKQFTEWRSTKGKSSKTPPHLIKATLEIIEDYPKSQVIKALGINSSTLKRWSSQLDPVETVFVELPPSKKPSPNNDDLSIHINYRDITVSASGPSYALTNFVKQLAGGQAL